jgi:hypothetical protein
MDAAGLDIVDFVDVGIEVRHTHTLDQLQGGCACAAMPAHPSLHAPAGGVDVMQYVYLL